MSTRVGSPASEDLGDRVLRLERLPLRPLTARDGTDRAARKSRTTSGTKSRMTANTRRSASSTPGGCWRSRRSAGRFEPLDGHRWNAVVAVAVLWRTGSRDYRAALAALGRGQPGGAFAGARSRRPRSGRVARAGLLCRLGCWAVAAVDPEWMAAVVAGRQPGSAPEARDRRPRDRSGRPGTPAGRALGMRSAGGRRRLAARRSRTARSTMPLATRPAGLYPGGLPLGRTNPLVARHRSSQEPMPDRAPAANPGRRGSSSTARRSSRPTRLSMKKADAPECTPPAAAG